MLDENEIGIPDQKVIAYPAKLPLQVAATALTDDRGVYRIHGLEPGTYHVRTAAKQLEDGSGLLPTFHKETMTVDQSITVDVDLDQQADEVDLRPLPGHLFRLTGKVVAYPPAPVTVTLISDAGRVRTVTASAFAFEQLAPGNYELIAEAESVNGRGKLGSFRELPIDRDTEIQVSLDHWRPVEFKMQDEKGNILDPANARITARHKDLDGGGRAELLKLAGGRAALGPGRWEISVEPPGGYYAVSISGSSGMPDQQRGRADGWTEVQVREWDSIIIKLSSHPGSVHGIVTGSGDPTPGAPVYLEAYDKSAGTRLGELHVTRTDLHGAYRFTGLGPGLYRILSTFEYDKPEPETMQAAGARLLNVSEGTDTSQDVDLYAP